MERRNERGGFALPVAVAVATMLAGATVSTGCARNAGPVRVNAISRSSTVGRDFNAVPRGVTIPAAGFGTDLVGRPKPPSVHDEDAMRVGGGPPSQN